MTSIRVCSPGAGSRQVGGAMMRVDDPGELVPSVAVEEIQDERYEEDTPEQGSNSDTRDGSCREGNGIT